MNRDNEVRGVFTNKVTRRPAGNGPHRGSDEARSCTPVGGVETRAPQFWSPYHIRIHCTRMVKRRRGIILEEIDHLGSGLIFIFKMDRFNDGFGRRAMSAASIGEVKNNMRFSRSRLVVHFVHLRAWGDWF